MTTKEFIKAVEELGYEAVDYGDSIEIEYIGEHMTIIFQSDVFKVDTVWLNNNWNKNAGTLFALIFQYACTPIKDRKEKEKKYYLRHKWIGNKRNYLIKPKMECKSYTFQNFDNSYERPTTERAKFTEKEIEEIKEKLNTNLEDFELVEVE